MINVLIRPSAAARDAREARRAARKEKARLRSELASYRTAAERSELHAIIDRHSNDDAEAVRRLLA